MNKPQIAECSATLEAAFLSQLTRAVAPPCLIVDPATDRVLASNEAAEALLGVENLQQSHFSQFHKHSLGALSVFAEEVVYRGAAWTRRLTANRADGEPLALEYEARAFDAGDGVRLVFMAFDLSERGRRNRLEEVEGLVKGGLQEWRRIEHLFNHAETMNDLILSSAGEGIYGVDAKGNTTFVNPAAEDMLGWRGEDLFGRSMHDLIHHHHADGSCYPVDECPIYNAFRFAKVNVVEDEVFWRKDGKPLRVEYTSTPIIESDEVLGAVIVFRDITERKNNERRLHEALAEVEQLKQRLEMENSYLQEEIRASRGHHEIIGVSSQIAETVQQIELVAPTDANVLIIGESGTGKELVAQAIHLDSDRAKQPLIRVNCAAIPRELFESEFFGHVKGAFTGAVRDRVGRFQLAHRGTIFLDEVGEIPLELQGKLLRVLQERSFERIGEAETHAIDVRVIAATNRNLAEDVAEGRFREDLYFRLNVFPINLAPLRDRRNDIGPLAQHFLNLSGKHLKVGPPSLSRANVAHLESYDWPGNVRELANVMERAVILSQGGRLQFDLPSGANSSDKMQADRQPPLDANKSTETPFQTESEKKERDIANITAALKAASGRVSGPHGAAELLGVKPTTLYSRIRRLGINSE